MMREVERVDGLRRLQARELGETLDGALPPGFDLQIREPFKRGGETLVGASRLSRAD